MKQSHAFQNGSFYIKKQTSKQKNKKQKQEQKPPQYLELVNRKSVGYTQPIPLASVLNLVGPNWIVGQWWISVRVVKIFHHYYALIVPLSCFQKGETALHIAARRNDPKICRLLLDTGCDHNLQEKVGHGR